MQYISEFRKVSFDQFLQDSKKAGFADDETSPEVVRMIWENLKMPIQAPTKHTKYDLFLPYSFYLPAEKTIIIPTGICCITNFGHNVKLAPRPCLKQKYGMRLHYSCENNHIIAEITTASNMCLSKDDKYAHAFF